LWHLNDVRRPKGRLPGNEITAMIEIVGVRRHQTPKCFPFFWTRLGGSMEIAGKWPENF